MSYESSFPATNIVSLSDVTGILGFFTILEIVLESSLAGLQ